MSNLPLLSDFFVNRDLLAVLVLALELYSAVNESEQSVILTLSDVGAGVDLGPALSDKDIAGQDELSVGSLGTKTLGLAVAAVLGGANALLMSKELQTEFQHHATSIIFLVLWNGSGNCEKRVSPPSADRGG